MILREEKRPSLRERRPDEGWSGGWLFPATADSNDSEQADSAEERVGGRLGNGCHQQVAIGGQAEVEVGVGGLYLDIARIGDVDGVTIEEGDGLAIIKSVGVETVDL